MRRREPPPLATWMLRHMTAGTRDEALDGDLHEVFLLGRSNAWYWRQVAVACVLSWCSSLYARGPVLFFALLWSMLSPLWYATLEAIETSQNFDRGAQIFGPFWLPLALIVWVVVHAAFLWAGLLVYRLVHVVLKKPLQQKDLRRAFWIVPMIFPPVAGIIFLVANLYWYSLPGLAQAKLASTSWGQISDLGTLANFIRFPYFIALVFALWGTVHSIRRGIDPIFLNSILRWTPVESDPTADAPMRDSTAVRRFLLFMVAAGLVNSMIAALFLCRLPDAHSVRIAPLFLNALMFVAIGALGGIAGSWLYWISPASPLREGSPVPFPVFALTCAAGWVWVPAMMLFAEQLSAVSAFVAMLGAFMLTAGLRRATYFAFAPPQPKVLRSAEGELFAESLYQPPLELHGYLIALGVFSAGAAIASRSNYTAAFLLAISASIFAWKNTVPRRESVDHEMKRAARRVADAALPAILLTLLALLDGVAHRNGVARASIAEDGRAHAASHEPATPDMPSAGAGVGGYQSVVLWPYPERKEIMPPLIASKALLAPGTKPLIIRFNGPYWFLQPPSNQPGLDAHVAHGTPVSVNVESNNSTSLVMNAHQRLSRAIPTARCRSIEIGIENRDNREGLISLGVLLTDEDSSPKKTLYLGQQPIVSTEPGNFFMKTTPAYETIRFSVPHDAPLRKFNEITVMFLPDIEHTFVAPKMAIQQFELFPR